jgi:hypothetical protein
MAKAKLDPLFVSVSGKMGDFVFRKSKKGEAIIARRPRKSNTEPSEAQKAVRDRLAEANRYARAVIAEPDLRASYEELGARDGKGAFAAARDAYLNGKA